MDLDSSGMDFSLPDIESQGDRIYIGNAIQERLSGYFGPGYIDESLSKYIIVMLTNKTSKPVIEKSLHEYLGEDDAADCSDWLFANLPSFLSRRSTREAPNHSTQPQEIDNAQATRHIHSSVSVPNAHVISQNYGSGRPANDWFGDRGQGDEDPNALKREELEGGVEGQDYVWGRGVEGADVGGQSIEPIFTEEELRALSMRVPLSARRRDKKRNKRMRRKESQRESNNDINNNLPGINKSNTLTKRQNQRINQMEHQQRNQRRQHQERLVVTVNGNPVDSIGINQVKMFASNRANGHNPNNAAFYAATPKSECSVLVKGLAGTATNAVIRAHFSTLCGPIPRVSVLRRPISGEKSDLAWISLRSERDAEAALQLNGSTLLSNTIRVWPKESEDARQEVARMNKESMDMYKPDFPAMPYGWGGWEEEERHRRSFKWVRGENGGAGAGGGGPEAMDVQGGAAVKEEQHF